MRTHEEGAMFGADAMLFVALALGLLHLLGVVDEG